MNETISTPYANRRHWVIGSGASLKETPLDLLKGEITWGMNRIHLFYDQTDWRPTFFFMVDYNQQNPRNYWHDCIRAHWETEKFLWKGFRDGHVYFPDLEPIGDVPNTTWIDRCAAHHYYAGNNHSKRAESWHLPDICTAFSGLGAMLQLSVLHGASEIYLLGCDLYGPDYGKNHMVEEYSSDLRDRSDTDNINMIQMHMVASRSSPVPIYNATVGGNLGIHPRRDVKELLCQN